MKIDTLQKLKGFSLVELMIAMTLGLVVSGGAITLYVANTQSYALNSAQNLMQENANFAMYFFEEKINSASVGNAFDCSQTGSLTNTVWSTNSKAPYDPGLMFSGGIRGYSVGKSETGFKGGVNVANLAEENDFIVFDSLDLSTADTNVRVHNANAANFKLDKVLTVKKGQILAVLEPDCSEMAIFMSSNDSSLAKINHNTGIETNGFTNCSKALQGGFVCTGSGNKNTSSAEGSGIFSNDAIIATLDSSAFAYTVQPVTTDEGVINSLFKLNLNEGTEQEMVRGIDSITLSYGMNTDATNTGRAYVGRYMSADEVDADASVNWSDLLTIKVSLQMSSEIKVRQTNGAQDFIRKKFERVFTIKSRVL